MLFQSTRPRGTRRIHDNKIINPFRVSIHASARDATTDSCTLSRCPLFQSTRPRGTRRRLLLSSGSLSGFQSTRPRGTRHCPDVLKSLAFVSIHASARDATVDPAGKSLLHLVSIHASARDATLLHGCQLISRKFQSTRPRGTRLLRAISPRANPGFNPRVREGRDVPVAGKCKNLLVSIHASARDATSARADLICEMLVSIHASARDATVARHLHHQDQ